MTSITPAAVLFALRAQHPFDAGSPATGDTSTRMETVSGVNSPNGDDDAEVRRQQNAHDDSQEIADAARDEDPAAG